MGRQEKEILTWADRIIAHYERSWRGRAEKQPFTVGPVAQISPDFAIVRFDPSDRCGMWTYATAGMSQPCDEKPIELHMFAPFASDQIVELLAVTAHFHRTGARLDHSHSVNFGRPWLPASECSYGLISRPYLDGPELEIFHGGEALAHCLWLLPVTGSEVAFKKMHGLERLEQAFDDVGLDYLDPARSSAV